MAGLAQETINGTGCWTLANDTLKLWLSKDFGPRVLGLSYRGGENLLAFLPDAKLPAGAGKEYSLRGGHRLWIAPERPEITYLPDDQPPRVEEVEGGWEFIQEVDQPLRIQKSWVIRLEAAGSGVLLEHRLVNRGEGPFTLAPWAVTMLRPGGEGLLPLTGEPADEHGLWPNRELVFWPYTDLTSRHLKIINQGVLVSATMEEQALKVGAPNPQGWIAYRHDGLLFVKRSRYLSGERYLDRGASHQIYCSPDVIELETLGPVAALDPGQSVNHRETWQVYPQGEWPEDIHAIYRLGNPSPS